MSVSEIFDLANARILSTSPTLQKMDNKKNTIYSIVNEWNNGTRIAENEITKNKKAFIQFRQI